ncbi:hypothetical protein RRG08_007984 [Elysia crispata]|uniref:Uncharacterized protein n=1 Tax=Elysia crispata TaxID=231223 RepID=A0AAE0ZIM1_9GAST|nr:hypothetical protein RRG08_007984 [Elysia crispata]
MCRSCSIAVTSASQINCLDCSRSRSRPVVELSKRQEKSGTRNSLDCCSPQFLGKDLGLACPRESQYEL